MELTDLERQNMSLLIELNVNIKTLLQIQAKIANINKDELVKMKQENFNLYQENLITS